MSRDPYLDARRYQAMKTDQSGGRGWDFSYVPAEPRIPASVKIMVAVIVLAGVVAMAAPSIARLWL